MPKIMLATYVENTIKKSSASLVGAFKLKLGTITHKAIFWVGKIQKYVLEVVVALVAVGVFLWCMNWHIFWGWDPFGYFVILVRP